MLHDGELVLDLERGGKSLQTFPPFDDERIGGLAVEALRTLIEDGRVKRLQIERVDGSAIGESPSRERLKDLGFREAYRGYVLGPSV